MDVEWDPAKRASNLKKHRIDFADAVEIFSGPCVERVDGRFDYGEERIVAYGFTNDIALTIAYTWRGQSRRIISARKCTSAEAKALYEALQRNE